MKDMVGQKFNRLLVVKFSHTDKASSAWWHCKCDCGKEVIKNGKDMRLGRVTSCGCFRKERHMESITSHGMTKTKVYRAWHAMKERCNNPKDKGYKGYGGRGIKVCPEWNESFENFYADMGEPHSPKHSLDRVNNDGNYEPGNCRWATKKEQAGNTRGNHWVTHEGETKIVTDWAEQTGISKSLLYDRLNRGWSVEKALTTPIQLEYSNRAKQVTTSN